MSPYQSCINERTFTRVLAWHCDRQPEYRQPQLPIYLGSRLFACIQSNCRSVHTGRRYLVTQSDRQFPRCRGCIAAGVQPERNGHHRRSRRAKIQYRWFRLHRPVGPPTARSVSELRSTSSWSKCGHSPLRWSCPTFNNIDHLRKLAPEQRK